MDDFKRIIDEVKEKNDIVAVISEHIGLGHKLKARCPFHDDHNPSFSVNAKKQYFYCFGCGEGGDVIRFIEHYKNLKFWEALTYLAERAGINIRPLSKGEQDKINEQRKIEDILFSTVLYYRRSMPDDVKSYLIQERGLKEETIEEYQIGYANGGLRDYLINKCKYSIDECLKAGVIAIDESGQAHDFFYHRIIFPNLKRGRVIGLSGRIYPDGEPKYLHLKGRPISLYNQDFLHSKEILMVEGVFDCLMAIQHGFSAIALQGVKNFKEEYLSMFSKMDKIYICLDGDEAGREGMRYLGCLFEGKARVVELPYGVDLDDFLRKNGKDKFKELLKSSLDPIEYEISLIPQDIKKLELTTELKPIMSRISKRPGFQQEVFIKDIIRERFNLSGEQVKELWKEIRKEERENYKQSEKDQEEEKYIALFPGLVDLVENQGKSAFLIKEGDDFLIKGQVEIDGKTYYPPPKDKLRFVLPSGERVLRIIHDSRETDKRLYDDTVEILKRNFELPSEEYYHLLALWVMHTYLMENFNYSPQICFYSLESRGKTRAGMTLIYISYRGIFTEDLREAVIIRDAERLNASFFLDVMKVWETALKKDIQDVLLQRFQRGSQVARVINPEKEAFKDTEIFSVFGPTIYATNEASHRVLESRGIVISMPKSKREFENEITPESLLYHKERMVAFRARNLEKPLPYCDKPSADRLGDIMKPLYQVLKLVCPEREANFLKLIREIEEERKMVKSETIEAEIIEACLSLEDRVSAGALAIKDIADKINEGRKERYQFSPEFVGRKLRDMGFKKRKVTGGLRAIIYDKEKLCELALEHGIIPPQPP